MPRLNRLVLLRGAPALFRRAIRQVCVFRAWFWRRDAEPALGGLLPCVTQLGTDFADFKSRGPHGISHGHSCQDFRAGTILYGVPELCERRPTTTSVEISDALWRLGGVVCSGGLLRLVRRQCRWIDVEPFLDSFPVISERA